LRRPAVRLSRFEDETIGVCEPTPRRLATALAMQLLGAGVPLSLLMDLAVADGPDSRSIMALERPVG
jgi:hypothetical protein